MDIERQYQYIIYRMHQFQATKPIVRQVSEKEAYVNLTVTKGSTISTVEVANKPILFTEKMSYIERLSMEKYARDKKIK